MASGTRFDPASASPEGTSITTGYSNGQRGPFSASSLDKSSNFREGNDNRTVSNGAALSRGDVSHYTDLPPISQCLNLDPIPVVDQKITRLGEFKRVLSVSSSIATEDGSFGAHLHAKPLPPPMLDELKRFKSSIFEVTLRAKDRAKLLNESILKLDRYRHAILSRKRPRSDGFPNERSSSLLPGDRSVLGTNLMKAGPQTNHFLSNVDIASPRSDDRPKNMIPGRRIRTSMVDTEARNNSFSRPSGFVEKDRELLRPTNGAAVQADEKGRGLSPGSDGWERKMKRKRSMGLATNRTLDGDQDHKRTLQQRFSNDNRSRLGDIHGFRSGSTSAMGGVNKLDGASQASGLNVRPIQKADPDNVSTERRDRVVGADKEKVTIKGLTKQNTRDGNQAGISTPLPKLKASRGPRTVSGASFSSSVNFSRTPGVLEGLEQSSSLNKTQGINGINNRKRPQSTLSSSSKSPSNQVAQWVGQRPQKISRVARRTSLVPPVANRDEALVPTDEFPSADTGARLISVEPNGSALLRRASGASHQFKLKVENVPSPAGFSESEDSGAADKSKEKGKISGEAEDKAASSIQKATNFELQTKKNKTFTKEETGDGVRRQGRSGRLLASSRGCLPLSREKVDDASIPKQRSTRPVLVSDKIESKSGRPPTKKLSDRKASIRPGHVANVASDFTDKTDDDHEELIAAATFARKANYDACSSPFWQQMEPIFAFVAPDDIACLQEQRRLTEELENSLCLPAIVNPHIKDRFTSSPAQEKQIIKQSELSLNEPGRSGCSIDESQDVDSGRIGSGRWLEKIIPLSQRLLAALIVEDEVTDANHIGVIERELRQYTSGVSPYGASNYTGAESNGLDRNGFELEPEAEIKNHTSHSPDNFATDGSITENGFGSPKIGNLLYKEDFIQEDGPVLHSSVGEQHKVNGSQSNITHVASLDCSYQQMSLDDRILLELQSIGLYPEPVPDLAHGEDDEVSRDISKLKEGLFHQVKRKRNRLCKLEKAVARAREVEERSLERLALNKLVDIAYKKYMACRGGNASHGKSGANKISKQVAVSFVKRTLARCRKFEETGTSCFAEHLFKDEVLSAPICGPDVKCSDADKEALAVKPHPESFTSQQESKAAGTSFCSVRNPVERCGPHINGLNKDLSDQSFVKDESWPNRGKKRELLLDDVGNVARGTSNLGRSLLAGTKGKRSERDRDGTIRNSLPKAGRPTIGSVRAERKNKTKPRQKTAQLSTSVNALSDRAAEMPVSMLNSTRESGKSVGNAKLKEALPSNHRSDVPDSVDHEGPIDLSHLVIPGIDELDVSGDLVGQGQDLDSWLGCVDGMQDHDNDYEGPLSIPMDDLSVVF